jgi:hypothetical protein
MSKDYGLFTFVTSLLILAIEIRKLGSPEYGTNVPGESSQSHAPRITTSDMYKIVQGELGFMYESEDYPHPAYIYVAPESEQQLRVDMSQELERLRIASNTQRMTLTKAKRMPPETSVSKMIAERTRAYIREDALKSKKSTVDDNYEAAPPREYRTREVTGDEAHHVHISLMKEDLWRHVASKYDNRVGVILGVGEGRKVSLLLSTWKNTFLYLVDPYIHIWRGYNRPANVDDKSHQLTFENLRYRLTTEFGGKFMFIRDFSTEFAKTYRKARGQPAPGFVFVDANPSFKTAIADIEAWYEILDHGGLIAGTLFKDEDDSIGVRRAVTEFASKHKLRVLLLHDEMWALEKPL